MALSKQAATEEHLYSNKSRIAISLAACILGVCLALFLAACQSGQAPTPTVAPLPPIPTADLATLVPPPIPSPLPALAATPTAIPVNLAKWQTYEDPGKAFSFRYPPDWGGRGYTQALTRTLIPLSVDTVWLHGPSGDAAPEFVLLYNWPSLEATVPVTNGMAWSSVAGLAKLFLYSTCSAQFDAPAPTTISGQQTMGVKYLVQCDRLYAGYLVGFVYKGVNYGMLVDVPAQEWDAWRPTFETILASFTLK